MSDTQRRFLSYEDYLKKFQSLSRRKIFFDNDAIVLRGYDADGNFIYIDGTNDEVLTHPVLMLDLGMQVGRLDTKLRCIKMQICFLIQEIIDSQMMSKFQLDKIEKLKMEYKTAEILNTKIKQILDVELSDVDTEIVNLQRQETMLRNERSNIDKNRDSHAYILNNREILRISQRLDLLLLDRDLSVTQDKFLVIEPGLSRKIRLDPNVIRLSL